MATPDQLVEQRQLLRLEAALDPDQLPQRLLYALPRVRTWSETVLPTMQTDGFHLGASSPAQQADAAIAAFIGGDAPGELPPHIMQPEVSDVWALRSYDLRFFGWFWRKRVFVLSSIASKQQCETHHLYRGFVDQAVSDRNRLNLDSPKSISGSYHDFF